MTNRIDESLEDIEGEANKYTNPDTKAKINANKITQEIHELGHFEHDPFFLNIPSVHIPQRVPVNPDEQGVSLPKPDSKQASDGIHS
jgi:hypothetical protein